MPFSGGPITVTIGSIPAVTAEMDRKVTATTVTIASGAAVSGVLDLRDYAMAILTLPAGWDAADIGVQVCATADGTFTPLLDQYNAYGENVSIDGPVAAKSYALPPWAFPAQYVKVWSHNGSGVNVNQTADRIIGVQLKS